MPNNFDHELDICRVLELFLGQSVGGSQMRAACSDLEEKLLAPDFTFDGEVKVLGVPLEKPDEEELAIDHPSHFIWDYLHDAVVLNA